MLAQAWKLHALKSKTDKKVTEGLRLRRGTKTRDIHQHIALAANKGNFITVLYTAELVFYIILFYLFNLTRVSNLLSKKKKLLTCKESSSGRKMRNKQLILHLLSSFVLSFR